MVWYGVSSILWQRLMLGPGSNNGALFVNAAVMYGNTGEVKGPGASRRIIDAQEAGPQLEPWNWTLPDIAGHLEIGNGPATNSAASAWVADQNLARI